MDRNFWVAPVWTGNEGEEKMAERGETMIKFLFCSGEGNRCELMLNIVENDKFKYVFLSILEEQDLNAKISSHQNGRKQRGEKKLHLLSKKAGK